MRRNWVTTRFFIWVAIACLPILIVPACKKEIEEKGETQSTQDSTEAARCLRGTVGLTLPDGAKNAKCHVASLMAMWVYARFDASRDGLKDFLLQEPLSKLPPLAENPELVKELQVNASNIPWWLESTDGSRIIVSQVVWLKPGTNCDWECTLSLCVDERSERAVVYIQYSEEPVSHRTE